MPRITENITAGLELECVRVGPSAETTIAAMNFTKHMDHSIRGDHGEALPRSWPGAGVELISRPITVPVVMNGDGRRLLLTPDDVDAQVRAICSCVAHVNSSCGFHLHLGRPHPENPARSLWSPDRIRTMLVIGQILEPRIFALVHPSRRNNHHCERIAARYTKDDLGQFYPVGRVDPVKYNNQKRYCWLNLIETARVGRREEPGRGDSPATGTFEIRLLGETASYDYIWAWTRIWLKIGALVAYAPASLAISHCCFSDTLDSDFFTLKCAYDSDTRVRTATWGPLRAAAGPAGLPGVGPVGSDWTLDPSSDVPTPTRPTLTRPVPAAGPTLTPVPVDGPTLTSTPVSQPLGRVIGTVTGRARRRTAVSSVPMTTHTIDMSAAETIATEWVVNATDPNDGLPTQPL